MWRRSRGPIPFHIKCPGPAISCFASLPFLPSLPPLSISPPALDFLGKHSQRPQWPNSARRRPNELTDCGAMLCACSWSRFADASDVPLSLVLSFPHRPDVAKDSNKFLRLIYFMQFARLLRCCAEGKKTAGGQADRTGTSPGPPKRASPLWRASDLRRHQRNRLTSMTTLCL